MFDVAGGVRCWEHAAQRSGYSDRSNAVPSPSLPPRPASRAISLAATGLGINAACYRDAIRDSRIALLRMVMHGR